MDPKTASLEMMERFWAEWFRTVASASGREAAEVEDDAKTAPPRAASFPSPEALRQLQDSFLDALARHCDEYMRSPQFLDLMKRSLDNALAFRQQVNDFLEGVVAAGFHPPTGLPPDQAVIVDAIRETERKLRDRVDALSDRIAHLEARLDGRGTRDKTE